jgi:hypothetical protein
MVLCGLLKLGRQSSHFIGGIEGVILPRLLQSFHGLDEEGPILLCFIMREWEIDVSLHLADGEYNLQLKVLKLKSKLCNLLA